MKRLTFLIFVLIGISVNTGICQNITGGTTWKTKEDFIASEKQVVENIKWLETHPFVEDTTFRKQVGAYVMIWMIDCPYLTIKMDFKFEGELAIDKEYEYAGKIATIFIMGKVLYLIEHKDEKKKIKQVNSDLRGVISMITIYNEIVKQKGDSAKNDIMEMYVKLNEEGKLEEYVKRK